MEGFSTIKKLFLKYYPWKAHFFYETLGASDIKALLRLPFTKKGLKDGEYIKKYETEFKGILDPKGYAFSFGSGRMALYAILDALGIKEGDEVILPAFTCEVVVYALLYRKIKPVYVDIELDTFNLDAGKIERLITSRTRAIIAQHNFGVPCDLVKILGICAKFGIFAIEDCALSLGSYYKDKPVGTYGHASFFSTDRTKIISTLWGGMAFTKDIVVSQRIRSVYEKSPFLSYPKIISIWFQVLVFYLLSASFLWYLFRFTMALGNRSGLFFGYKDDKTRLKLPKNYPCRLSNLQAALGLVQLEKLPGIIEERRNSVERYASILKANGVNLGKLQTDKITLRFSLLLRDRKSFIKKWKWHVAIGSWFNSVTIGRIQDLQKIGYVNGSCPVAEFVNKRIVNLPTCQKSAIARDFLDTVIMTVRQEDLANYENKENTINSSSVSLV